MLKIVLIISKNTERVNSVKYCQCIGVVIEVGATVRGYTWIGIRVEAMFSLSNTWCYCPLWTQECLGNSCACRRCRCPCVWCDEAMARGGPHGDSWRWCHVGRTRCQWSSFRLEAFGVPHRAVPRCVQCRYVEAVYCIRIRLACVVAMNRLSILNHPEHPHLCIRVEVSANKHRAVTVFSKPPLSVNIIGRCMFAAVASKMVHSVGWIRLVLCWSIGKLTVGASYETHVCSVSNRVSNCCIRRPLLMRARTHTHTHT